MLHNSVVILQSLVTSGGAVCVGLAVGVPVVGVRCAWLSGELQQGPPSGGVALLTHHLSLCGGLACL